MEVDEFIGCVFGVIFFFSFYLKFKLVVDFLFFERFDEIVFNVGMLDKFVILKIVDYLCIV